MTATTTEKRAGLQTYVREALRNNGNVKVADLTPEQHIRALAAPEQKAGLRGKALAIWIMAAQNASQQIQDARDAEKAASRKSGNQAAPRVSKRAAQYGEAVVQRSKIARSIEGYKNPASLKQHKALEETVDRLLGKASADVTPEDLFGLVGVADERELLLFAQSKGGSTKGFKTMMTEIPDEVDIRPRHIAASMLSWIRQMEAAA